MNWWKKIIDFLVRQPRPLEVLSEDEIACLEWAVEMASSHSRQRGYRWRHENLQRVRILIREERALRVTNKVWSRR